MAFPDTFAWGVGTSAYQVEGAANTAGRGPCIWDQFCGKSGNIADAGDAAIACDHYNRSKEDVAIMATLGMSSYRLSLSWPRILPEGVGMINEPGLAFYDELIDDLLRAKIEPWVTLFHWDYPLALYMRGGWLNPDSPMWFAEYVGAVVRRLSDRVSHWITLNEPQVYIGRGHGDGLDAPGLRLPIPDQLRIAHNNLIAHGRAVQAIRADAILNRKSAALCNALLRIQRRSVGRPLTAPAWRRLDA
jgi:beta-glucosidase